MDEVECVVIGAGVVGLAIARKLALQGREVLILERAGAIGTETSSRNSEVIHAGIYYPRGSLKARFCVSGRAMLYDYAASRGVPHRRCGKLIVATTAEQVAGLEAIVHTAAANGVEDLRVLDAAEARALEPALACTGAVLSPSTGIVDSHALMLSLLGEAEAAGAMLALHTDVTGGHPGDRTVIETRDAGGEAMQIAARMVVNAAGLHASRVATALGVPAAHVPQTLYARGSYYAVPGRAAFSRLVYPLPEPGGLGVHLTLDLGGSMRFGPDVEWIDGIDYTVSPARRAHFEAEIRRYWPGLPAGELSPTYCGIRPKIAGPGEPAADFRIDGPEVHGVAGLVNLFGIESPGLTSSLAIARETAERLARQPARALDA